MQVTHTFISAKADTSDTTLVQPSNWNASHTIQGDYLVSSDFAFATQTPGGNLSVGSNVITLNPFPTGVIIGDNLLISGGTGTAEVVPVTAATTSTVIVTCANTHSGSWTIQSATAGIQEAVNTIPAAGGVIFMPAGVHTIYKQITLRKLATLFCGAGQGATFLRIASLNWSTPDLLDFPITDLGVFYFTGPAVVLSPADVMSPGCFRDFTVRFYQPDSTDRTTYTQWPYFFYAVNAMRPTFENLTIVNAWGGFNFAGGAGFEIRNVRIGAYNRCVEADGIGDTCCINRLHAWPFEATGNQQLVMWYHPLIRPLWFGRMDDLKITESTILGLVAMDMHPGTIMTGGPGIMMSDTQLDNGGIHISAGRLSMTNVVLSASCPEDLGASQGSIPGETATYALKLTVASSLYPVEVIATNCWIPGGSQYRTVPLIDVNWTGVASPNNNYGFQLTNSRFVMSGTQLSDTIHIHTTDAGTPWNFVIGNKFENPAGITGTFTPAIIRTTGAVYAQVQSNTLYSKQSGTGSWYIADTDSPQIVKDNAVLGWGATYPATQQFCVFENNLGSLDLPYGTAVASATSITPTGRFFHITGTTNIVTIVRTAVIGFVAYPVLSEFTAIFDGICAWTTAGNISVAGTSTAGQVVRFIWDSSTSKYTPILG